MSEEDTAAQNVGTFVQRLLSGWPVYAVVLAFLMGYHELYMEKKIADGVERETSRTETVRAIQAQLSTNTKRIEDKVEEVERDTKAILRLLAEHD